MTTLHFRTGDVQMREIIKLTNYKRFGVSTKITFKGETKDPGTDDTKPAAKKP